MATSASYEMLGMCFIHAQRGSDMVPWRAPRSHRDLCPRHVASGDIMI